MWPGAASAFNDVIGGGVGIYSGWARVSILARRQDMANPPSLEELLIVSEEEQHLLNCNVKDDHLTEIAKNLTHWEEVAPYLNLTEAEEAAIERNYNKEERKRLVH